MAQNLIDDQHCLMLTTDQINGAMEFAQRLGSGETLSSVLAHVLTNYPADTAAGSEIAGASFAISGTQVTYQITTTAAPPGNKYYLYVQCSTNQRTAGPAGKRIIEITSDG